MPIKYRLFQLEQPTKNGKSATDNKYSLMLSDDLYRLEWQDDWDCLHGQHKGYYEAFGRLNPDRPKKLKDGYLAKSVAKIMQLMYLNSHLKPVERSELVAIFFEENKLDG